MIEKHTCPSCKGKGHVFEAVTLFCVLLWVVAPFERNNSEGITRRECGQCDGKGWIIWEDET